MCEVKQHSSSSWFSREGSRRQAAKLRERLVRKCHGQAGVFLTLTYSREEWGGPRELYRAASAERHVRRFIEGLSAYLGESLTGRWIRKMEFQRGGWVHWHLIILGVKRIDYVALSELWGFGHVWISRASRRRVSYFAKYLSKESDVAPEWIYAEPVRSVKVVATSPGFWGESSKASQAPERLRLVGCYETIGQSVERMEQRCVLVDGEGKHHQLWEQVWVVVARVLAHGGRVARGSRPGWLRLVGAGPDGEVRPLIRWAAVLGVQGGSPRASARGLRLHLTKDPNPPDLRSGWVGDYLRWVLDDEREVA